MATGNCSLDHSWRSTEESVSVSSSGGSSVEAAPFPKYSKFVLMRPCWGPHTPRGMLKSLGGEVEVVGVCGGKET